MSDRFYHYVRHADIPAWEALGWVDTNSLARCHHGYWSALMEWRGEGEPKYPRKAAP